MLELALMVGEPPVELTELADDLLYRIAVALDANSLGRASNASRVLADCVRGHAAEISLSRGRPRTTQGAEMVEACTRNAKEVMEKTMGGGVSWKVS